jgi:hypothetical protein
MSEFFASGHAVDVVLAVLALEVAAISVFKRGAMANAIIAALPGLCLLLALRASLTGLGWPWIAGWLALSLPAHLADLARRPPRIAGRISGRWDG